MQTEKLNMDTMSC